jgi:uncharacterized repeat protein (TIGR03803 family)
MYPYRRQNQIGRPGVLGGVPRRARLGALLGAALVAVAGFSSTATAQLTTLHSFTGGDGANPYSSLIADPAGNLYGTTNRGGAGCGWGCGTVFQLDTSGTVTVLHSFNGSDGEAPYAGLTADAAGNLYGTT